MEGNSTPSGCCGSRGERPCSRLSPSPLCRPHSRDNKVCPRSISAPGAHFIKYERQRPSHCGGAGPRAGQVRGSRSNSWRWGTAGSPDTRRPADASRSRLCRGVVSGNWRYIPAYPAYRSPPSVQFPSDRFSGWLPSSRRAQSCDHIRFRSAVECRRRRGPRRFFSHCGNRMGYRPRPAAARWAGWPRRFP